MTDKEYCDDVKNIIREHYQNIFKGNDAITVNINDRIQEAYDKGFQAGQSAQWISVEDRLPDENFLGDILIHRQDGSIGCGQLFERPDGNTYMRFNGAGGCLQVWSIKPSHWMPLPTPSESE